MSRSQAHAYHHHHHGTAHSSSTSAQQPCCSSSLLPTALTSTSSIPTTSTLVDLASLVVAVHYPFQLIEDRYKNIIPEPVQKSVIYHSFPKHESDVLVYASSDFNPDRYGVEGVVQIGFHVSGNVIEYHNSNTGNTGSWKARRGSRTSNRNNSVNEEGAGPEESYHHYGTHHHHHGSGNVSQHNHHDNGNVFKVSATFDRGKITSVSCNCENEHSTLIFWCDHVIALALHRIRRNVQGKDFVLRVPISETLLQLNRSQLQKLVQYLISDHTEVLPTAQRLADEILFMKTDDNFINRIHGAPDPTAGPSPSDPHSWALNESQIQAQVRAYVSSSISISCASSSSSSSAQAGSSNATNNNANQPAGGGGVGNGNLPALQASNSTPSSSSSSTNSSSGSSSSPQNVIQILIDKMYKMIQSRDSNAERIVNIITNELVRHATKTFNQQQHGHNTHHRGSSSSSTTNNSAVVPINSNPIWDQITRIWNVIVLKPGITVAERAALRTTLRGLAQNDHLPEWEEVSDNDEEFATPPHDNDEEPVAHDTDNNDAPVQAPEPSQSSDHPDRPTSSNRVKRQKLEVPAAAATQKRRRPVYKSIFTTPLRLLDKRTNPHDYDVLLLHSRVCHDGNEHDNIKFALRIVDNLKAAERNHRVHGSGHHGNNFAPSLRIENAHVLFDVLKRSHPQHAFQVALIGLSNPAHIKHNAYVHEKHLKLVEKLIGKLVSLPQCHGNNSILVKYAERLVSYSPATIGPSNSSASASSSSSSPQQQQHHNHPFPLISFVSYLFNALSGSALAYKIALKHLQIHDHHHTFVHSHLEAQQIALATNLLTTAKHEPPRLDEISSTLIRVVKSNTNLFRLAQEVFKHASNENLVTVAFNIALHVVKATKYTVHRRRWEMVRWVVSCGVEIGVAKLFYLVRNWGEYFSAVEAVGTVASNILAWVGGSGSGGVGISSNNGGIGLPQQPGVGGGGGGGVGVGSGVHQQPGLPGLAHSNKMGAPVDKRLLEELANAARNLAIQCAKNDPQNCALNTLTLCETDGMAFETSYQIVLESASKEYLTPQQIFTIARYMEHRGYTQRAYRLAVTALQHVHIGYNQDTHSLISEIHWTCNLSHQLSTPPPHHQQQSSTAATTSSSTSSSSSSSTSSPPKKSSCLVVHMVKNPSSSSVHHAAPPAPAPPPPAHHNHVGVQPLQTQSAHHLTAHPPPLSPPTSELENLIPLLIRNIKCATVLTEILRRSITIMSSYENAYQKTDPKKHKSRVYEKLSLLIEGTIDSYITTTHSRLVHISPRHYSDFIEFLTRARENFVLAPNGNERFKHLVESMKATYKGKKKLLFLLTERFG